MRYHIFTRETSGDPWISVTKEKICGILMISVLLSWTSCWVWRWLETPWRSCDLTVMKYLWFPKLYAWFKLCCRPWMVAYHDDVIKWKYFAHYWPFMRGIHRSPVNFPHRGQWRGALIPSLICAWTNSSANNGDAGDLKRHRSHYDVIVMYTYSKVRKVELWCALIRFKLQTIELTAILDAVMLMWRHCNIICASSSEE